jgi:hypothetical protein
MSQYPENIHEFLHPALSNFALPVAAFIPELVTFLNDRAALGKIRATISDSDKVALYSCSAYRYVEQVFLRTWPCLKESLAQAKWWDDLVQKRILRGLPALKDKKVKILFGSLLVRITEKNDFGPEKFLTSAVRYFFDAVEKKGFNKGKVVDPDLPLRADALERDCREGKDVWDIGLERFIDDMAKNDPDVLEGIIESCRRSDALRKKD